MDLKIIKEEILQLASSRQNNKETACHDLVSQIYTLWMSLGLELAREMDRIRQEELDK